MLKRYSRALLETVINRCQFTFYSWFKGVNRHWCITVFISVFVKSFFFPLFLGPNSVAINFFGVKVRKVLNAFNLCMIVVRLGPKITETVKGKLSLGAKILQVGGMEKIFKQLFAVKEEEKLLKACQCYLSTTAGPIAGLLFISTEKVAFCSERSLKFYSSKGELIRVHYKVLAQIAISFIWVSVGIFCFK